MQRDPPKSHIGAGNTCIESGSKSDLMHADCIANNIHALQGPPSSKLSLTLLHMGNVSSHILNCSALQVPMHNLQKTTDHQLYSVVLNTQLVCPHESIHHLCMRPPHQYSTTTPHKEQMFTCMSVGVCLGSKK